MEEKGSISRVTNKKYNYPKEKQKKIKTKIYKKKKYKKRNWNDYLNENKEVRFEINIKRNKNNKEENDIQGLITEEKDEKKYNINKNDMINQSELDNKINHKNQFKEEENLEMNESLYDYMNKESEMEKDLFIETEINSEEEKEKEETLFFTETNIKKKKPEQKENNIHTYFEETKLNDLLIKNTNEILDNKIEKKNEDSFIFNGKLFKKNIKLSNYIRKDKIKRYIYKCEFNRHDEKLRQQLKKKCFCNATIEYILPGQKMKSKYILKEGHSQECETLFIKIDKTVIKTTLTKEQFISECELIMNSSSIYDRNLFKTKFLEIYNKNKYNFPMNTNFLSNIITKWRNSTSRFNKSTVWDNKYDYQNRLILRDYRTIYAESAPHNKNKCFEYIIWANDENIKRIRKSKHYYLDGTFHHPSEFKQLLILMYKDIITDLKIPGIYILLNGKSQILYDEAFGSLINIITNNRKIDLDVVSIISDSETALINIIKKYFPNSQRIACYFHFKQDLLRNLRIYGLYNESNKLTSDIILKKLGKLPFIYKGKIEYVLGYIENIKKEYPIYINFLDEYFIKNKLEYFKDLSLDYCRIPNDCRTNNYLENYNGYIKSQLGKHRIINWINFINFIKLESQRSIDKLYNNTTSNKNTNSIPNLIINNTENRKINEYNSENNNINFNITYKKEDLGLKNKSFISIIYSKVGFINIGASCFINSIVQILIHCKPFIESITNNINIIENLKLSISFKLLQIIKQIVYLDSNNKYIDISQFYNLFGNKHLNFNGFIQQDSQEFLRLLLEDISFDLNEGNMNLQYTILENDDCKNKLERYQEFINNVNKKEKSIITELFYPIIITTYQCKCKKEIYTFQRMLDIPLLLPDKVTKITIENLFNNYFNEETVEFNDICQNCGKILDHIKKLKLANCLKY